VLKIAGFEIPSTYESENLSCRRKWSDRPAARTAAGRGRLRSFRTTRSEAKAAELEAAGVKPIVVDVFDGPTLSLVMATVQPDVVVH
jgi:hypothetical protein